MKILFDQCTPRQLRKHLIPVHEVTTCAQLGWDEVQNGELINQAEAAGFELIISFDQNITYQQNLSNRKISLIVLGSNNRKTIMRLYEAILEAVEAVKPGSYECVNLPHERNA